MYNENPEVESWSDHCTELSTLSLQLSRSISAISTVSGKERDDIIGRSSTRIDDIEILLREMSQQLNQMRKSNSVSSQQLQEFRRQYSSFQNDLKHSKINLNSTIQRQASKKLTGQERNQRNKVLQINQHTVDAEESLIRSKQVLAETEAMGADTAQLLVRQTDQLENTNAQLHEARDLNERARRTLVGMARRVMTDRIIQAVIVILELGIIGFLVYWKFIKPTHK